MQETKQVIKRDAIDAKRVSAIYRTGVPTISQQRCRHCCEIISLQIYQNIFANFFSVFYWLFSSRTSD